MRKRSLCQDLYCSRQLWELVWCRRRKRQCELGATCPLSCIENGAGKDEIGLKFPALVPSMSQHLLLLPFPKRISSVVRKFHFYASFVWFRFGFITTCVSRECFRPRIAVNNSVILIRRKIINMKMLIGIIRKNLWLPEIEKIFLLPTTATRRSMTIPVVTCGRTLQEILNDKERLILRIVHAPSSLFHCPANGVSFTERNVPLVNRNFRE